MHPIKGSDVATGREKVSPKKAYEHILTALTVVCIMLPLILAIKWLTALEPLFPDFFGLWSFGRYVLVDTPSTIYDHHMLQIFEIGLGMPDSSFYPFPYPPWILLILAPFGVLHYAIARWLWLVLTFAASGVALAVWRWHRSMMGLFLVAPSATICCLVGQNGFVTAALMLGGIRLLRTRPLIAGALLASVAYNPQLAI